MNHWQKLGKASGYIVAGVCLVYSLYGGIPWFVDILLISATALGISQRIYSQIRSRIVSSMVAGIICALVCPVVQLLIIVPFVFIKLQQATGSGGYDDCDIFGMMLVGSIVGGILGFVAGASGLLGFPGKMNNVTKTESVMKESG